METIENKNSHIVYFRRAPLFANESRKELEEYFAGSSRSIGSYFTKGSTRTATGLTISEENLLMPHILAIDATDRDFRSQVNTWFQNIDTKVPGKIAGQDPTKEGVALEIGLEKGSSEPLSKDNMPINVEQFIRVRHGLGHPYVAPSPEAAKGNQLVQYYMYDPQAASQTTINVNDQKDKALAQYLTIKTSARSVRMYLTLLGVNPLTVKKGEETTRLRSIVESTPGKFLDIVADKTKEVKYVIEDMVFNKVLDRVGDSILTKDGTVMGRSMKEAIIYLTDPHNTKVYASLKALLQEAWKKTSQSVDTLEDLEEQPITPAVKSEPAPVADVMQESLKVEHKDTADINLETSETTDDIISTGSATSGGLADVE